MTTLSKLKQITNDTLYLLVDDDKVRRPRKITIYQNYVEVDDILYNRSEFEYIKSSREIGIFQTSPEPRTIQNAKITLCNDSVLDGELSGTVNVYKNYIYKGEYVIPRSSIRKIEPSE
jgi:hypothetical protein